MDPTLSQHKITYVVDPKKETSKTCVPFTSPGYLCEKSLRVGGKPCTVGTVRSVLTFD